MPFLLLRYPIQGDICSTTSNFEIGSPLERPSHHFPCGQYHSGLRIVIRIHAKPSGHECCMYVLVNRVQEDSSYRVYRGLHLWNCFLRRQCLGLSDFLFLQKEGTQMGNLWTWMQIKQLLTSWGDASEETSEDTWLMKGIQWIWKMI